MRTLSALVCVAALAACQTTTTGASVNGPTRDARSVTALLDAYYGCVAAQQAAGLEAAIAACRGQGFAYATRVARDNGVQSRFARQNAEQFILPTVESEIRKAF